ncbi:Mg/Co/Ni transporter MgtE [marine gamma proteobacterium HTCC2207]|jgi:magnesium transporter|uniref:Magnesium transporter MgtE n=1 Tax=gamma proteobacterium HTCC2207 TaxID=314287 RepID=Q1YU21_9GAMM|nr:Mg/Co/Ni transporter MgtE [marine gamma proteobacterium HTCC2207] [gamma proteobacterium HTCC2207]MBT5104721.1 magnesium transporter [Porticoccaceae bacterium]MBT6115876.1 magnesium transporter [Porticoccaceae bacterium]MDB4427916.1 magnesium transporter [Porticoccaceae bacterium]MDC0588154.1 magnesium transporter [Porticoccaceae bacterium]
MNNNDNSLLAKLGSAIDSGTLNPVRHILNNLSPPDIAHQLETAPPHLRNILWEIVDPEISGEVLQELSDDIQLEFLNQMDGAEVASITEGLDVDDIVDILQQLPDRVIPEVLKAMSVQDRLRVESVLTYSEDTAGGLMDTEVITVRPDITVDVVLRYLRRFEELPDITDNLFVVSRNDTFLGTLPLSKMLTSSPNTSVREVMNTEVEAIHVNLTDSDVAQLFQRQDLVSAPVVDDQHHLVGRITIDDVVDVIVEDADHSLLAMAGLSDTEDTFSSISRTAPRRALWLGLNLLTAILASSAISLFEATLEKVVALAILMPIVASMGGVAGSQTLTVVIRGMALGQIERDNFKWLLSKEFTVGALNGMLWAIVMGAIVSVWFDDWTIALVIAAAMAINLVAAAVAGTLLPIMLRSLKIDPALAGSVILTTVTDIVGFVSFLGLATVFYS